MESEGICGCDYCFLWIVLDKFVFGKHIPLWEVGVRLIVYSLMRTLQRRIRLSISIVCRLHRKLLGGLREGQEQRRRLERNWVLLLI